LVIWYGRVWISVIIICLFNISLDQAGVDTSLASDGVLFDEHLLEKELCDMFLVGWLKARARETGLIKRSLISI
jgi:hypothetical protein